MCAYFARVKHVWRFNGDSLFGLVNLDMRIAFRYLSIAMCRFIVFLCETWSATNVDSATRIGDMYILTCILYIHSCACGVKFFKKSQKWNTQTRWLRGGTVLNTLTTCSICGYWTQYYGQPTVSSYSNILYKKSCQQTTTYRKLLKCIFSIITNRKRQDWTWYVN